MKKLFSLICAPASAFVVLTLAGSGPALAQALPEGLNDDVVLLGRSDPDVRKATAIVNGAVITDLDVDQRLQLVVTAAGSEVPEAERQRLRLQVLRNLIDEKLQIGEAQENDVVIDDPAIDRAFARVAANFRQTPEQFEAFLRSNGTSPQTLRDQIHAEIAWSQLLRRRVEPFVTIGDDEVEGIINRLKASAGEREYRLGEIFLAAPATEMNEAQELANRIIQQVRSGASFVAYARQYSEASTAAVGGDMGWMRIDQLNERLRPVVQSLQRGQVSAPIPVPGGVTILAMLEDREIMGADPMDALLTMKQIAVPFPASAERADIEAMVLTMTEKTRSMGGCGRTEAVAAELGGEASAIEAQPVRAFPEGLQDQLLTMTIGQATPVFGTQSDARVLVLCGRDEAPAKAGPSFDEVYAQLNEERISRMARRYLRDLRQDAIVDYR